MRAPAGKLVGSFAVSARHWCVDPGVQIHADRRYRFIVEGTWLDLRPPAVGPEGTFHPGGLREYVNWAKRLSIAPWMALLMRVRVGKRALPWQMLGSDGRVRDDLPAGRLQFCANDVLGFYWNNQGALQVSVFDCGPRFPP